ncbi:MAG TPA: RHS repeat-associated core domain-containing protein [Pyrinomonadaceae bacterium]|jgi:RHS repeat-associated protein|nr:RHS repeat-associated core domain-containing protein [Pyrinomonadaceae bacterium]
MPFGEELNAGVGSRSANLKYSAAGQDNLRKRFTGYEKDAETGLDFAEARYYNNQHGRFTATDPLLASGKSGNPQTFNRYVYVLNNPLLLTDPTGLQATTEPTGKWYVPKEPDGYSTGKYVRNGAAPPAGFVELTTRNSAGHLCTSGEGLRNGMEVIYNPRGPLGHLPIAFGAADFVLGVAANLSDYDRNGWDVVRTPEAEHDFRITGQVNDASFEFYFAVLPAVGGGARVISTVGKGFMESRILAPSILGDLTPLETKQIQTVVNEAGRPIEVVGSAANGIRRGVGTTLPIGKGPGTRSDIDYIAPRGSLPYYEGLEGAAFN